MTRYAIFLLRLMLLVLSVLLIGPGVAAQVAAEPTVKPLRVVIAGLVHGHASGFLERYQHRPDLEIVGVAEPSRELFDQYAKKFNLDSKLYYSDLDDAIQKTHPDAVLGYTNTYDHRRVVEIAARHHVAVMVEKPLAVSVEDARAIEQAARAAKIPVLVNYETTWYRSNHAAYDLVHDGSLGEVRRIVVHDGHQGPKEINVQPEFFAWLTDPKLDGAGALFDFGCYGADLATWLMDGRRPDSVNAVLQQIKPEIYPHVDDEATVVLTYPKAVAILQASWNWPFDRKDMELYGQHGQVFTVKRDDVRVRITGDEKVMSAKPIAAPYDDSISELRAVVFDGAKPDAMTSLETNMIVVEILDAARRSALSGTTMRLEK
jgi:scyllo-inositol 2-dehydrogenase (NADP+)